MPTHFRKWLTSPSYPKTILHLSFLRVNITSYFYYDQNGEEIIRKIKDMGKEKIKEP